LHKNEIKRTLSSVVDFADYATIIICISQGSLALHLRSGVVGFLMTALVEILWMVD